MADVLHIEVVRAFPENQVLIPLELPVGSTLRQALEVAHLPDVDMATGKFGIYGKLAVPDTILRDRDRIEIYRPLIADPKEVRRARAAKGAKKKSTQKKD
ncbi:MAG TPA: RnfH family protein [Rhodocyclaceae bacterium]|jgi:putative ubiquitin-RnfH superfamily antitoxin RatB of RatAB toxin-antitoxin module|nr:RnfH family protein [Rhodocyclaceae bacterium]